MTLKHKEKEHQQQQTHTHTHTPMTHKHTHTLSQTNKHEPNDKYQTRNKRELCVDDDIYV